MILPDMLDVDDDDHIRHADLTRYTDMTNVTYPCMVTAAATASYPREKMMMMGGGGGGGGYHFIDDHDATDVYIVKSAPQLIEALDQVNEATIPTYLR